MLGVGNRGLFPLVGSSICAACLLLSALALSSCSSSIVSSNNTPDIDVFDKVRSLDILPRYPTQAGTSTTSSGPRAQPVIFQGAEVTDVAAARPQPAASGNGYDLNFE